MRNHVPPRPPRRQTTSPACLGPEGSNPHFPHSISTLPFADAPSTLQDRRAQALYCSRLEALYMRPCSSILVTTLFPSLRTAALVLLPSGPVSQCRMRPSDSVFPSSIDSSLAEL